MIYQAALLLCLVRLIIKLVARLLKFHELSVDMKSKYIGSTSEIA